MNTTESKSFKKELEANQFASENSHGNEPVNVHYNSRDDEFVVTTDGPGIEEKRVGRYHKGRKTYDDNL